MTKIIPYVALSIAIILAITGYLYQRDQTNIQKGIDKQVAADIAKSNQNIAERRETDAHFDKLDAAAVCREYGREWMFSNGKSECH